MSSLIKTVFMISGEASGDLLGADLSIALQRINPDLTMVGVGGPKMASSGIDVIEDMQQLSIIGFIEVLKQIVPLLALINRVKSAILACKPDVIVLIDAPGFNLRIAKWAADQSIKVVYYVSPQLWAWRPKRINLICQSVDQMAVLLPFELSLYQQHRVPVSLVQHPLYLVSQVPVDSTFVYRKHGLDSSRPLMLLMPGSRRSELKRHLPVMLDSWHLWREQHSDWQCVCLAVDHLDLALYQACLDENIPCLVGQNHSLLSIASACLCCSGTATLEVALHRVPMIVMYQTSWLNFFLAKCLVKVNYIALCNLVVNHAMVPEFLQSAAQPKKMMVSLHEMLFDPKQFDRLQVHFDAIAELFSLAQSSDCLAQSILSL